LTCFPGPGGAYTGDSGVPSNFYDIQWQILEMRRNTTEGDQPESLRPECQYVWSLRYIDAPVLRDENTDQDGLCDDQRLYYLGDANFNVTTLVDTGGDAVERYIYSPYGKVTIYDATWSSMRSASSYDNVVLYTGREGDRESGLYCYRNRYYDVNLARFLSRDPIGYQSGDSNLYAYVAGSPVNGTDPTGLQQAFNLAGCLKWTSDSWLWCMARGVVACIVACGGRGVDIVPPGPPGSGRTPRDVRRMCRSRRPGAGRELWLPNAACATCLLLYTPTCELQYWCNVQYCFDKANGAPPATWGTRVRCGGDLWSPF
jgi:RHS repeat-associated protein